MKLFPFPTRKNSESAEGSSSIQKAKLNCLNGSQDNGNTNYKIHRDLNKSWGWFIKQLQRFLQQVTVYFI